MSEQRRSPDAATSSRHDDPGPIFEISPSGASETCLYCGTIYDRHELVGYVPPFGDGCEMCNPQGGEHFGD